MFGGLDIDRVKSNIESHTIPAVILLVLLAFALMIVFLMYFLGRQDTILNIYLLFLTGISGIFVGYLLFNTQ